MSQKLQFTKVSVLSFSRKSDHGSVKVSCAPSVKIAKALKWGTFDEKGKFTPDELPDWQKSGQPEGKLAATLCEFAPADTTRSKFAFDLITLRVNNFEFVRTQIKKGKSANKSKGYKTEIHFTIDYNDQEGAAKLERYIISPACVEGALTVTYDPEPVQTEIEMPEQTDERLRATSEEED